MATKQQSNIDWEVPEYQNALKVVIKYEIQTLLERLSQTGEETVVLTANTTDLCVGHLASEKGKRFLSTNEVGEMKNKFLYYCTVEGVDDESGITVSVLPQDKMSPPARGRGTRGRPRGAETTVSGRGKKSVASIQPVFNQNQVVTPGQAQGDVGQRLSMPPQSAVLNNKLHATNKDNVKGTPNVKQGEKRQQTFTAEEIQDMIVSAESKRRKLDSEKHSQSAMKQVCNRLDNAKVPTQSTNKLPQTKQHVVLSDDESIQSNDFFDKQGHQELRSLDDSALGTKNPQFTQENLEFQKFLQQYNAEVNKHGLEDEEEEDYGEEEFDEEDMEGYEMMGNKLEKGEFPQAGHFDNRAVPRPGQILPLTSQVQTEPSQFQRQFQNFQKNNQVFQNPQTNKGQKVQGQGQTLKGQGQSFKSQGQNNQSEFDPNLEIKEEVETEGYGDNVHTTSAITETDSKSRQNKPPISLQSIIKNAQKSTNQTEKKQTCSADEGIPEIKEEPDPHDLEYKQSADSSSSGLKRQADSSNQHVDKSPHRSDVLPDSTQQTKGPKPASPRPVSSSEKPHPEDMSEADVSAKLEMLSAKMSWVVEYPKNFNPSQPQQQQQQPVNFPQEEEEEEEDYPEDFDEEDDEEGLDDSDLEKLHAIKQYRVNVEQFPHGQGQFHGRQGQFQNVGYLGQGPRRMEQMAEGEDDDFDEEEMEHLGEDEEEYDDDEFGELDSEDEQVLREMGRLPPRDRQGQIMLGRMQQGNMKLPPPGGTMQMNYLPKGQSNIEDGVFPMAGLDTDNFMLMGAMAKCLVCNKLIRKNDMVQHNIMHIQEDEDEEDDELEGTHKEFDEMHGEMGEMNEEMGELHEDLDELDEGEGEMQEMEEMHDNVFEPIGDENKEDFEEEMHGKMQGEGDIQEEMRDIGENVDFDGDQEEGESHEAELTAEKLSQEQLPDHTCQICMKSFKNKHRLANHVKIHDPKDIECDLCNKTFRLESYLAKHRKKMHPNAPYVMCPQGKDMGENFSCGICKQSLPSRHELDQHMTTHT